MRVPDHVFCSYTYMIQNRMLENPKFEHVVVYKLQQIMLQFNHFVIRFKQLALQPNINECRLLIKERSRNEPQYNMSSASQVTAIVAGDDECMDCERDINVVCHNENMKKMQETKGYYDPLQYPLLFSYDTYGWDIYTTNCNGRKVTCQAYYSYMLQIRPNDKSILLRAGRLLQQYVVDNYFKIES